MALPTEDAPAASLDIYTPDGGEGAPRPVVLWIHGGGFISSSPTTVADYAIMLAHAGYTVASLGYSLAPGVRYPAPVQQGNAALRFMRANASRFGGDPGAHRAWRPPRVTTRGLRTHGRGGSTCPCAAVPLTIRTRRGWPLSPRILTKLDETPPAPASPS